MPLIRQKELLSKVRKEHNIKNNKNKDNCKPGWRNTRNSWKN